MSPNYASTDPPAGSDQRWIESLHQARDSARGLLDKCHAQLIGQRVSVDPPAPVRRLHTALCDYARHISPRRDVLQGEYFEKELDTVTIPKSGEFDAGYSDRRGEISDEKIQAAVETEAVGVAVEDLLDGWAGGYEVEYVITYMDPQRGEQSIRRRHTCYVPVAIGELAITELDACIDDLGWVPAETPGVINSEEPL